MFTYDDEKPPIRASQAFQYDDEDGPAPLQDHSPWAFNMTDPTTGRTVPNWLPRGVSNVLFSQTGELMDFFGAEETADKLRQTSQDSFGFTKNYDWEDVKEEGIGVLPTIGRGLMYGLESTPTSLGYLGMMLPGMVGGAPAAIVGSAPVFISELERIAQGRARADGVEEGIDPTLSQYGAAAPSALANIALDRFAARTPFVSNAGPLKSAAIEFGTEAVQGGGEEFATMYGTQSQPDMDVLDAALAEGVAVGPQAAAQAGYAAYRDRFRQAVVEGEGSAETATQSPFAPPPEPMAPPPEGQVNPEEVQEGYVEPAPEGTVETGPATGLEGQADVGIPTYGPNVEYATPDDITTTVDPNIPQEGVGASVDGVEVDPTMVEGGAATTATAPVYIGETAPESVIVEPGVTSVEAPYTGEAETTVEPTTIQAPPAGATETTVEVPEPTAETTAKPETKTETVAQPEPVDPDEQEALNLQESITKDLKSLKTLDKSSNEFKEARARALSNRQKLKALNVRLKKKTKLPEPKAPANFKEVYSEPKPSTIRWQNQNGTIKNIPSMTFTRKDGKKGPVIHVGQKDIKEMSAKEGEILNEALNTLLSYESLGDTIEVQILRKKPNNRKRGYLYGNLYHNSGRARKMTLYLEAFAQTDESMEDTIAHEIGVHGFQRMVKDLKGTEEHRKFWSQVYKENREEIKEFISGQGGFYRNDLVHVQAEEFFAFTLEKEIAEIAAGKRDTFSAKVERYLRQVQAYLDHLTGKKYSYAQVAEIIVSAAERGIKPSDITIDQTKMWDRPEVKMPKVPEKIDVSKGPEDSTPLDKNIEYTKEEQKTLDDVDSVVELDRVGGKDWKKTHGTPETWADVDWVNALLLGRGELIPANVKRHINAQIVKANDALIEKYNIDLASLSITGLTGLPAQEAYLEARYRMMGKYLKVDEFAGQIYKTFEKADKADQSQVFDYLTGQIEAEQMNVPDNVKDMAVRLKANIDKNAETLIRMGALRRDTVFDEEGGNHYLPRLYLKHVLGEQNYRSLSGGGAMSDQSYTKRRKLIKKGDRVATGKLKGPDGKAYDINDIMSEKERDAAQKRHDLWRVDRDEFLENNQEKLLEMYEAAEISARKAKAKRNNPDKIFNEDEFDNTELTDEEKAKVRRKVEEKAVPARLREVNEPKVSAYEQSKEEVKAALADQDNSDWTYEYRTATEEEVAKDAPYIEILGEIMDPGYLGASTTSKVGRDIATAEFLIELANSGNTDWIAPQGMTKIHLLKKEDGTIEVVAGDKGKAVSSIWLRREADLLQERIDSGHMTEEAAANAKNVVKGYKKVASDIEAEMESSADWQKIKKQFRQVPDSPKYGVLAGMYINKRIYNDIFSSTNKGEGNKYWRSAEKLHAWFKVAKVPLNPPTIARNVISNYVLMNLDGIGLASGAKFMVKAFQILRNQNNLTGLDKAAFDAMKKYGIELQTFTSEEMSVISKEFKNLAKQDSGWRSNAFAQAMAISKALSATSKALKWTTDRYGAIEAWQKLAVIRYHMEHGATEWEAVRRAQETLFDYSLLNKGAKAFRKVPIGAPFLSFSLLSLRRFGQVASRNPMRLFHWFALSQLIWAAAATSEDVDDEDLEKLHKGLPEYLADKPSPLMVPLPFRDSHGRMQFLDLAYIHPFGIHWEILKNFAGGNVDEAAETFGITGAPLVQFAIAMSTGLDPFTKQKITEDGYTWGRKMWDRMGFLYSQMTPSIVDFRGDGKGRSPLYKMYEAAAGRVGTSKLNYGEAKFSMGQAIARLAGINTYGIDPETSAAKNLILMKYKKADLQTAYKKLIRNPNISEEERAKIMMEFEMQMMAMVQDMEEMAELANIHPNLKLKDIKE